MKLETIEVDRMICFRMKHLTNVMVFETLFSCFKILVHKKCIFGGLLFKKL